MEELDPKTKDEAERSMPDVEGHRHVPDRTVPDRTVPGATEESEEESGDVEAHRLMPPDRYKND